MEDNRTPYEQAYEDHKKGLKYREIAEKYGVSISTVKSWKSRYWSQGRLQPKNEKIAKKVATRNKKGCNQKSKRGAPEGNKNAVGNNGGAPKGNKNAEGNNGGAPDGNRNRLVHGIYSALPSGTLSPEDVDYLLNGKIDPDEKLELEIKILDLRMRELWAVQNTELKQATLRNGLSVKGMSKKLPVVDGKATDSVMDFASVNDVLLKVNSEITKMQREKVKGILSMKRLKMEERKVSSSKDKDCEASNLSDSIEIAWKSRNK